ncbi:MAG: hypothetical protein HC898_05285 [Phycisphaerales bacterium]|nr:hypothetical protein [Phycisphaerales bacterium]
MNQSTAQHSSRTPPASTPDADPLREVIQQQLQKPQPRPQPDGEPDAPKDAPPPVGVFIPADADGMDTPGEADGFNGSDQPDGPGMMQRAMRGQLMAGMMSGMEPGMGGMHQGNAVYRIDPHGFVTELFRETAMILQLAQHQGSLLVTTGNEGMIFRIDTDAQETLRLVDLEPQQISALAMSSTGEFILGTANPAQLIRLHHGFADKGNYISPSLEAQQISLWGKLLLRAQVPEGTSLAVQTRSGNVQDPEHAPWSAWSEPMKWEAIDLSAKAIDRSFTVTSPPARFLQYRLNFTGTPELSPTASRVELAYITPNQKPVIAALRAIHPHLQDEGGMMPGQMGGGLGGGPSGGGPGSMGMPRGMNPAMMRAMMQQSQGPMGGPGGMNTSDMPEVPATLPVEWDASDPNGDTLQFKLEYQPMGTGTWILLEKQLAEPRYDWPIKRMPDGWYFVRITASDHPDNTPAMAMTATRISDPILIDNTPPEFREVQTQLSDGQWTLTAEVSDALSPIREVRYTLHGMKDWQTVLPDDKIYDSTSERITIKLTDLGSGPALVTLRALDSMGQARFHAVMLNVKP